MSVDLTGISDANSRGLRLRVRQYGIKEGLTMFTCCQEVYIVTILRVLKNMFRLAQYPHNPDTAIGLCAMCVVDTTPCHGNKHRGSVPTSDVSGVLGKKAALPCDIQPLHLDDTVSMVLWFKESDGEPLYTFDVRNRKFAQPKLWSSPTGFSNRAYFRASAAPAVLLVDNVSATDAGVYRCRVDFRNSPTRNLKVNFTVILPPSRPVIYVGNRNERTKLIEPYNEGSNVHLVCEVEGATIIGHLDKLTLIENTFRNPGDSSSSSTARVVGTRALHDYL
ncbi:hypothetical protein EVAR_38609_1 [Eumeta japonica]|uniref:Ig-like domain-containing protein n=1 Tax=Eumeta variegata TaxID=151549 RepID=A0A4C1WU27_EUMVA|nr:hypothetical protein EVAR_38609_1 [Eumeta japonica]